MIELACAAVLGLALGIVTGMPIGVLNVAIVNAATQGRARFATGIGIGGALADTVHSGLAFSGVGQVVTSHAAWSRGMALVAAVAIGGYAIYAWRNRGAPPSTPRRYGVVTGLFLTLPNPAALGAWIALAAVLWPTIALAPALVVALGVGIGSAAWFTLLARWIAKLPADHRVARIMPAVAVGLLAAIAIGGVVRAFS